MQALICEKRDPITEQFALEQMYTSLDQRLGRPAGDPEICNEMNLSLDEFHQILDRFKGLNLGSFQKVASPDGGRNGESLIRYIPDASKMDAFMVFLKSEVQEMLTKAIEALPDMERLIASLFYYDELTLKEMETVLGISEARLSQLHTKAMLRLRGKLSKKPVSLK